MELLSLSKPPVAFWKKGVVEHARGCNARYTAAITLSHSLEGALIAVVRAGRAAPTVRTQGAAELYLLIRRGYSSGDARLRREARYHSLPFDALGDCLHRTHSARTTHAYHDRGEWRISVESGELK